MKEGKYAKPLAKIQVAEIFSQARYVEKCFAQVYRDLYGDAMFHARTHSERKFVWILVFNSAALIHYESKISFIKNWCPLSEKLFSLVQVLLSSYKLVYIIKDTVQKFGRTNNAVRTDYCSDFSCPYNVFDLCDWKLYFFAKMYELFVTANVYIVLSTAPVLCRHPIQTPSPQHTYSDTSPRLSPCSDNTSSASNCDSEPDKVSTLSEQSSRIKKKRQRTTFSPLEVWELERAYRRLAYLTDKDEEDLVQRLGITAKSLKAKIYSYCKTGSATI